ncbi:MAG: response regulator, partial [Chlorobi bacterium]|nr:response regulator [Chlorobiota bacterium]
DSGLKVLEKIKRQKPSVKVIILTNYPFPQYMQRSEELGADYFLHKITDFSNVAGIIQKICIEK